MAEQQTAETAKKTVKAGRIGLVVKAAMNKTVTVKVDRVLTHPLYKKILRRSSKYMVHDENSAAGVGDTVRIVECRPYSKNKRWRLLEIVSKAK